MRCVCCNHILKPLEATAKSSSTGEYMDMCFDCLESAGIEVELSTRIGEKLEEEENYDE